MANSTINPVKITYENVTDDITTTVTLNGNTLTSIEDNWGTTLTVTTHYTLVGSTLTIKAAYLASIDEFSYLTLTFSSGNDTYLTLAYADLFMFEGLNFSTFDYQCVEFEMDGFCLNVFDFPYISNEVKALTFREFGTGEFNPILSTPKGIIANPTPYNDIPQVLYTSRGVFKKSNNNPRPKNLI